MPGSMEGFYSRRLLYTDLNLMSVYRGLAPRRRDVEIIDNLLIQSPIVFA